MASGLKVGDNVRVLTLRSPTETASWMDLFGPRKTRDHLAAFEEAAKYVGLEVGKVVTVKRVYVGRKGKVNWIEVTAPDLTVEFDLPADCLEKVN